MNYDQRSKYVDGLKEEDFQKAIHNVYRSKKFPSHMKLNILE